MAAHSSVLFREIHKNAWLRKLPLSEKKPATCIKKGEKVWTVFCVHDDTEPFLELYNDQKMATAHRPEMAISLTATLHVSPTICPQDDEFEFVITLPSDVIRLTAPSWDVMTDWVDTLSTKLREMHILSPKENIYSKNPEARPPLLPTRDPNSPLPLPPSGLSTHVPGVEIVNETSESQVVPTIPETNLVNVGSEPPSATNNVVSVTISTTSTSEPPVTSRNQTELQSSQAVDSRENVTVIEVSSDAVLIPPSPNIFDFSFMSNAMDEEEFYTPPVTPVLPRASIQRRRNNSTSNSHSENGPLVTIVPTSLSPLPTRRTADTACRNATVVEHNEDSVYEHVFLTNPPVTPPGNIRLQVSSVRQHKPRATNDRSRSGGEGTSTTSQFNSHDRGRNPVGDRMIERRPNRTPLQAPPQPFSRGFNTEITHRLTLREQQVLQLQKEMSHAGGVRLQLRRKDCIGSIALVDAFSAVWVAGWKQKDHPMLYNALHIGDRLVSVAGIAVQNANDAQRLIRGAPSLYVELLLRRVPCGRVFALRRESEGQDLGIIQEGKTAEIRDILPGSVAALGGLTPRTPSLDGLSLTTCILTEVNGRPLNLFFKDNEVRDRLNAVGLDISLLVQPADLVKQIKKQLKSLRNYKEYIVQ